MRYGADYLEEVRLRDGTPVLFRLVRAGDEDLLREGFANLSPVSRYRRFLMAKSGLSDAELHWLTATDDWNHLAIGAGRVKGGEVEEPLAVARFVRTEPDGQTAEAAIAVVDAWQGRGLGRMLFQRLAAAAEERGIRRFRVEMLAENEQMRALTAVLGERDSLLVADGLMTAEFHLPDAGGDPERVSLRSAAYRALAIAAGAGD
jgi:GNAT superfamily N-acetyltransferase